MLNNLPVEVVKKHISTNLENFPVNPIWNMLYCVVNMKNITLSSINITQKKIDEIEQRLIIPLKALPTKDTALFLQAFIKHDFYESRHLKCNPPSSHYIDHIEQNHLAPNLTLINHLNFSITLKKKLKI